MKAYADPEIMPEYQDGAQHKTGFDGYGQTGEEGSPRVERMHEPEKKRSQSQGGHPSHPAIQGVESYTPHYEFFKNRRASQNS